MRTTRTIRRPKVNSFSGERQPGGRLRHPYARRHHDRSRAGAEEGEAAYPPLPRDELIGTPLERAMHPEEEDDLEQLNRERNES